MAFLRGLGDVVSSALGEEVARDSYSYMRGKIPASPNDINTAFQLLNEATEELCARRNDYLYQVQRNKMQMTTGSFDAWIKRVEEVLEKVERLKGGYETYMSSGRSIFSRRKLNQDMVEAREEVLKHVEYNFPSGLLVDKPPEPVLKFKTPEMKQYPTLRAMLGRILELLKDDETKGIGIYGMVGVGKTTMMQNVNNHEDVASTFDIVIWLKVSTEDMDENLSVENLQEAVVRRLKMKIDPSEEVSYRISKELEDKRYLLLLDDVKEELDSQTIGIPENNNGSKTVLTTRYLHVISSMADKVAKMKKLPRDEAWKMFRDILNRPDIIDHLNISPIAWRVVNECDGLPLLIKIVASAFKTKDGDQSLWSSGLANLRKWPEKDVQGMKEVYRRLTFSSDNLSDAQKRCFIYGALYPEESDINADRLLMCCAADDINPDLNAVVAVRDDGHSVLEHLKNVSLLEKGRNEKYVRMHKCIRQFALHLSWESYSYRLWVKTCEKSFDSPNAEHWEQKNWISLVNNELRSLPEAPNCGMLSTLFLQNNSGLEAIPPLFFERMKNLRVLDLFRTGIASLPSSLSYLINLKVLYLNECLSLRDLPSQIAELRLLEALDIRGSSINFIPAHLRDLNRLKCLRVSLTDLPSENNIHEGVFSQRGVISGLSALEELVIEVKAHSTSSYRVMRTVIEEAAALKNLTVFEFRFLNETVDVVKVVGSTTRFFFPKEEIFNIFTENSPLWRDGGCRCCASFQCFVGPQSSRHLRIPEYFQYERCFKFCNGEGKNPTISKVLGKTNAFELVDHKDIVKLSDFGITSLNHIRACVVECCYEMKTIVGVDCIPESPTLPNLEILYLGRLHSLESIWEGLVPSGSFSRLKILHLRKCPILVTVFTHALIQRLSELRELVVEECYGAQELIPEFQNGRLDAYMFPKLKTLALSDMPVLRSIYANESLQFPSLEELTIYGCRQLHRLPFRSYNAQKLRYIEVEQAWWEALEWVDEEVRDRFEPFCCFT